MANLPGKFSPEGSEGRATRRACSVRQAPRSATKVGIMPSVFSVMCVLMLM